MLQQIERISKTEYKKIVKNNFTSGDIDNTAISDEIMPLVNDLPKFVTGNYFWRIYTKQNYCLLAGGNVQELTPFTSEQLLSSEAPDELMISAIHPDELEYCYSFVATYSAYIYRLPFAERNKQSINLYMRIRQMDGTYKWINVQYPYTVFDEEGKETGGLIVYTDLSHTEVKLTTPEMLIIDSATGNILRYKGAEGSVDPVRSLQSKIPGLSKRQAQILYLISKGKASKQIAAELNIAKNTVENHRQRMLRKFNAQSSIELMDKLKDVLW
jgi:DNA-binding CsgD family transcriptional regulator